MDFRELVSLDFFKKEIYPLLLTADNREFQDSILSHFQNREELNKKIFAILFNSYVEYITRRIKEEGLNPKTALAETKITLEKYYPEILSYINDFELLKTFFYPPSKPLPAYPEIRFSLLEDVKELERKMLRGIFLEFFDIPYKFDLYAVCIFTEKDLEETEFIEDWRKEQIVNEAKYLTQEVFFNTENSPYKMPAYFLKLRGKYWYVVKYYFPENLYIPNFEANKGFEKEWQKALNHKWLGYFYLDIYGKKPSVFNILKGEDRLFFEDLKTKPDKVILR